MSKRELLFLVVAALIVTECARQPTAPAVAVNRVQQQTVLEIADQLEQRIAAGTDTDSERHAAYERVAKREIDSAEDALGRAMLAGRLAQISGLSAPSLIAEVERYARLSAKLDDTLRDGAALRLLGTLYVMAPAAMLQHGDSEVGLELLEGVVKRWPKRPENQLRLAEAYVALGEPERARHPLCYCSTHRQELRPDQQKLLDQLRNQAEVTRCP